MNQEQWDEYIAKVANVCQVLGFVGIGEIITNEHLMKALEQQNAVYLKEILNEVRSLKAEIAELRGTVRFDANSTAVDWEGVSNE